MMLGIMWEYNHLRLLEPREKRYWDFHALPFGWAIISVPEERAFMEVENESH